MDDGRALLAKHLEATEQSKSEFARKAKLHPSTLQKILDGHRAVPDLHTAIAIEEASGGAVSHKSWLKREAPPDETPSRAATGTDGA